MSTKELNALRQKQDEEQEEVLDELIVGVQNLKKGGKEIDNELTEQEKLLGVGSELGRLWTTRWTTTSRAWGRPAGA